VLCINCHRNEANENLGGRAICTECHPSMLEALDVLVKNHSEIKVTGMLK
jgi:hypothetical protein